MNKQAHTCAFKIKNTHDLRNLTLPTALEPVKDIFETRECPHNSLPTAGVFWRDEVTTLSTPGGIPAFSANLKHNVYNILTIL